MKHRDLAALACSTIALSGVFLVFGLGWTLIMGGLAGLCLVVLLTFADLRKPRRRRGS